MRLALYQPDIPQNTGAAFRLGACFRVPLDIIEPCGFPFDDKRLRRSAMDYGGACELVRHASWQNFITAFRTAPQAAPQRLVLLSTAGAMTYTDFAFQPGDTLLLGRESHGVPQDVHAAADARVRIPIAAETRSLNVVVAAAVVLAEALRQQGIFHGKTVL
jgi:tRNA (cytidine/uridine-2'-O-)-methyltransferase